MQSVTQNLEVQAGTWRWNPHSLRIFGWVYEKRSYGVLGEHFFLKLKVQFFRSREVTHIHPSVTSLCSHLNLEGFKCILLHFGKSENTSVQFHTHTHACMRRCIHIYTCLLTHATHAHTHTHTFFEKFEIWEIRIKVIIFAGSQRICSAYRSPRKILQSASESTTGGLELTLNSMWIKMSCSSVTYVGKIFYRQLDYYNHYQLINNQMSSYRLSKYKSILIKTVPHQYYLAIELEFMVMWQTVGLATQGPRFDPSLMHVDFYEPMVHRSKVFLYCWCSSISGHII